MRFDYGIRKIAAVFGMAFVFCFSLSVMPAFAAGEPEVYGMIESFSWKEFGQAGEQLLKESGPRFGAGFAYTHVFEGGVTLKPRVELFGGTVDYDGATQAGVPVMSEVNYFGVKLQGDVGLRTGVGLIFEPFVGIGLRGWDRDIEDSVTVLGSPAIGYTEEWFISYGRLGIRFMTDPSKETRTFFEAGAFLPLYSENTALLSEKFLAADVTFKPKMKTSFFVEAGFKAGGFKMSAFYEALRFDPSDPVLEPYSLSLLYQPKSESDVFGVRIGGTF